MNSESRQLCRVNVCPGQANISGLMDLYDEKYNIKVWSRFEASYLIRGTYVFVWNLLYIRFDIYTCIDSSRFSHLHFLLKYIDTFSFQCNHFTELTDRICSSPHILNQAGRCIGFHFSNFKVELARLSYVFHHVQSEIYVIISTTTWDLVVLKIYGGLHTWNFGTVV